MNKSTFKSFMMIVLLGYAAVVGSFYYRNYYVPSHQDTTVEEVVRTEQDDQQVVVEPISREPVNINVSSWAYLLKGINVDKLANSAAELVVLDTDIAAGKKLTKQDIAKVKQSGKKVLAFLSIGEAENYRLYWKALGWDKKTPKWIGQESPFWKGVYAVNDPTNIEWVATMYMMIDQIKAEGFDGVVLGGLEAYQDKVVRDALANLIKSVANYSKKDNDNFIVVMQDGLELTDLSGVTANIDGFIKQDLIYSWKSNGNVGPRNPILESEKVIDKLTKLKNAGKTIFVVEYVSGDRWEIAKDIIAQNGFLGISAPRELNSIR